MEHQSKSSFPVWGLGLSVAFCALLAISIWLLWPTKIEERATETIAPPPQQEVAEPVLEVPDTEEVQSAVEEELNTEEEEPAPVLPRLNESDESVKAKAIELSGGAELLSLFVDAELIRKAVRAVHSLSEAWVVKEYRPIQSPTGRFVVSDTGLRDDENLKIYEVSPQNYTRYARYVSALTKVSPSDAVSLYQHFYPLMQEAYEELGYRDVEFNDVMKKALDQFLAVPEFSVNEKLIQPSVMYVYQDKDIERSTSLNKLKLRIGPENLSTLRAWARNFKANLEQAK